MLALVLYISMYSKPCMDSAPCAAAAPAKFCKSARKIKCLIDVSKSAWYMLEEGETILSLRKGASPL